MKNQSSGYSPVYSAPEQLDYDRGSIDTTTDIYALGCTFYEMLTGRPPFLGESLPMLHLEKKPTPLRQFRAEIPGELEKIVLKCLEKKQKDRYQSAGEILHELKKLV